MACISSCIADSRAKKKEVSEGERVYIRELYALATLEMGISPDYFLDSMQNYELDALMQNYDKTYKTSWEQTRFMAYITAQTQSIKRLKPTDIMQFPWDKEEVKTNAPDWEAIKSLREEIKNNKSKM